jgi:glycosyltransferase involved in cell wall biosynthesis
LETLLRDWSSTGWPLDEVTIVLHDPSGASRLPMDARLGVEIVGEGWPGLAWEWFGLGRVLRKGDVLFAPTNLVPRAWGGPTVLVVFDTMLESVPEGFSRSVLWQFRARYRSSARRATRVIVPSEATGRDVVRHYGIDIDRIRTICPTVGPEFRPRLPGDGLIVAARWAVGVGDDPFFLFVGKRSRRRNVGAVVEGFTRHRAGHPSSRLVFVGPSGGDAVPDVPGVVVAGHVTDDTLLGLMSGALACIYPSEYEGFGLPVAEAMSSGCPVVTLRKGALAESAGDAAVYLDRADPGLIALALDRLVDDPAFRAERVEAGLGQSVRFRGRGFAEAVGGEVRAVAGLARVRPAD